MIIQCKQCRTKFRFDDSFMQGSGVWLRCSRCGHVYFQENMLMKTQEPFSLSEPVQEPETVSSPEKFMPVEESPKPSEETPSVFHRNEDGMKSLDKIMAARKRLNEDVDPEAGKKKLEIFSEDIRKEKPAKETKDVKEGRTAKELKATKEIKAAKDADVPEKIEETDDTENDLTIEEAEKPQKKKKPSRKGSGKGWKVLLWSVLVIVVIPAVVYFYVFPQYGDQLVTTGDLLVKKINELRGVPEPVTSGGFINQMVKLQDVRYRRINNYILGQIGILEGTAVNHADFTLSRIQVKGEIVDAYSVVLGERASYAGNILTDEELTNLSEEEILMKLLRPEGLNNSNDRILPNGQIPFMVVFPNEPSGVIKTTVKTIGAERLLSE